MTPGSWGRALSRWSTAAACALVLALAGSYRLAGLHDDMLYDPLAYSQYAYNLAHGTFDLTDDYPYAHRLPVIVPAALAYGTLGVNPLSTVLWPVALAVLQVGLVLALGFRLFDRPTALLAGLLLAILPLDVIYSRVLGPDVVMATLSTAAVTCWLLATERPGTPGRLLCFLSGACFVLAVMTRVYAAVLLFFFVAHVWWRRLPLGALLWATLGALVAGLPVAALYAAKTGDPLFPVTVQANTFGQRLEPRGLEPLYYPRNLWRPTSQAGLFGMLFMLTALAALWRPTRERGLLLSWILPLFLFLQFGSMSATSYRPVFKEVRYIAPLCAPLSLLAASVLLDGWRGLRRRSRWGRLHGSVAHIATAGLAFLVIGLAVNSWQVVDADRARHQHVSESFKDAVARVEKEPGLPILFDHWRTGLAFSYYFRFEQGSGFYHGAEDSLRIGHPGSFGPSRFGYLPWYREAGSVPRGFIVLDEEVLRAARRSDLARSPYLGVRIPPYCYDPPKSWVRVWHEGELSVFLNPDGASPAATRRTGTGP